MSQKPLPEEYRNIRLIQNIKTQDTLTRVISNLIFLLNVTKQYQLDIKTKNKVVLFLDYLETKCKSLEELNRWSGWLITYGINICSLLQVILTRMGHISEDSDVEKRSIFMDNISKMVEDVASLVINYPYLFNKHHLSIKSLLTYILDKSLSVSDTSLYQLIPDILNISNYVNDLNTIEPFRYDEEISQNLLNYLRVLQKKIGHTELLILYDKVHNG